MSAPANPSAVTAPVGVTVHHGDSRDVLRTFADAIIDSVVCDPPYALVSIGKRFGAAGAAPAKGGVYARASAGFMGKRWDTGETAFDPAFWVEVLRVMKPGAHLVAFGGTRTYHRLVCAIEDAGFEVRDQLAWLFGSGFPKSHNQPCGWGTALKPAHEPICLARKSLVGTVAGNMAAHRTGALNIDGCRIGVGNDRSSGGCSRSGPNVSSLAMGPNPRPQGGRWPANVVHDGSAEVLAGFPDTGSGGGPAIGTPRSRLNTYGEPTVSLTPPKGVNSGSAARFFYAAKADAADRCGSKHPTVKPVDLMAWLVRLVTPVGGMVLDPFAGSGTTGMACLREGFPAVLIEREAEYVADIRRRLAHVQGADAPLFTGEAA